MVSNQTAFPSTTSERETERETEIDRERRLFDFEIAMHSFSWALIYVGEVESVFCGSVDRESHFLQQPYQTFQTSVKYQIA